jgi:hypothetical protein
LQRDVRPSHTAIESFRTYRGCPPVSYEVSATCARIGSCAAPRRSLPKIPRKSAPCGPNWSCAKSPGKSVQRRRYPQRRWWGRRGRRRLFRTLLQPPRREVVRVVGTPRRLRLLPARLLALRPRACLLPIPQMGVGLEPPAADSTRALPTHLPSVALALAFKNTTPSTVARRPTVDHFSRAPYTAANAPPKGHHSSRVRRLHGRHAARRWGAGS